MKPAIAANIVTIILELMGLRARKSGFKWKMFAYYTQLSNFVTLVSSILFLLVRGNEVSIYFRYLACCMLLMTVLVTVFILAPMGGGFRKMLLSGNGLYHHTLCPLISILSYIFLEEHVSSGMAWLVPSVCTLIYGVIMLILNGMNYFDGPYPFFRVHNQSWEATVLWIGALTAVITVLSILLSLLAD